MVTAGGDYHAPTVTATFSYSTSGNRTFELFGMSDTGTIVLYMQHAYPVLQMTVHYSPLVPVDAHTFDNSNWRVDANISGANISLGTGAQSSYVGMESASLTMVQNTGSAGVQIPCSSTNAPTGLTCAAGSESNGVSFTIPWAGSYRACASQATAFTGGGHSNAIYQIVETPNSAQTITQQGGERINIAGAAAATDPVSAVKVCGILNFSSAGQKTIRLFYEKGSTAGDPVVLADADAGSGQRDIHWDVLPLDRAFPAPVVNNSVTSSYGGKTRIEAATLVISGSTCTKNADSASWISSCSSSGTGAFSIVPVVGTFSTLLACTGSDWNSSSSFIRFIGTPTTSLIEGTIVSHANSATDSTAAIICVGIK